MTIKQVRNEGLLFLEEKEGLFLSFFFFLNGKERLF